MLNKLRRKFILVSTGSLLIVLLLLVACINLLNYFYTAGMQDQMLNAIAQNEEARPPVLPQGGGFGGFGARGVSPEAAFTTRFFQYTTMRRAI